MCIEKLKKLNTIIKIIALFIMAVALIIGFPLVINILFKERLGFDVFIAEWNAGDALAYYGIIISALITAIGVFISIRYSQINYREDVSFRVRPYLAITKLQMPSQPNVISALFNIHRIKANENITRKHNTFENHHGFLVENFHFIIENGKIGRFSGFNANQEHIIEQSGLIYEKDGEKPGQLRDLKMIYFAYIVESIGNGPAVNLRLGFNNVKTDKQHKEFSLPRSLSVGSTINVYIFCENPESDINNFGKYELDFLYLDIRGKKFIQKIQVEIGKNENFDVYTSVTLTGEQFND